MAPVLWKKNTGRNGWDPPLEVGPDQSVESLNISLYNGGLGTRRAGSTRITVSAFSPITGPVNAMAEFVPGQDLTAAQAFFIDGTGSPQVYRSISGSSTQPALLLLTLIDTITSPAQNVSMVTHNGKLYFAYDSSVNRLHVFDPNVSTTEIRRAGLGTPAAPTGADMGFGGLSLSRSYKVAYTRQIAGVTYSQSELSPVLTRTIAAKLGSTITKPLSLGEGETHWQLYAADTPTGVFYLMATTAVGTATYDDTAATIDTSQEADPIVGQNTPFPSVKFLASDGKRLLGFGAYETTAGDSMAPKNGRLYFGPVLDSSDVVYDDERINNSLDLQGFIDAARNSGAVDRGLTSRPVNNIFYAFQSAGIYGFIPTESDTTPYRRLIVDPTVGAMNNQSIVIATQKNGKSAVYFLDPQVGPYTVGGPAGLAWCGKDVKDVWDRVNKDATTLTGWGLWYADRNMVMFCVPTGVNNDPDTLLVLDVTEQYLDDDGDLRGGWTVWTGDFAATRCGFLFSNTFASPRSAVRVPHVALNHGASHVFVTPLWLRYDETQSDDAGTGFQAYITSGVLAQDVANIELQRAYIAASAEVGVTMAETLTKNFGDEIAQTSEVMLTPEGAETIVLKKFEDAAIAEAWALQVTLGDLTTVAADWRLHFWRADLTVGAPR